MEKKRIIFESLYRTSCFSQSFLLPYVYGILLRLVNYLMVFTYVICDVANFNLSKDKQPVAADKANSHQETCRNYFLSKACPQAIEIEVNRC